MTSPAPAHAGHDPMLIAASLDGSLDALDAVRVRDWLSGCAACIELRSDLTVLATATHELPTPKRPRDFTLSPDDAVRLRTRGWRGLVAAFAAPRAAVIRPLAIGLTTMGLAGILISSLPPLGVGGAASAPELTQSNGQDGGTPIKEQAPAAGAIASGPSDLTAESSPGLAAPPGDQAYGTPDGGGSTGRDRSSDPHQGRLAVGDLITSASPVMLLSIVLLVTGLTLVLLRWGARRLGDG